MDFEQTRKKLLQLAKERAETDGENMAAVEDIEIAASVTLLEYCVANNEQIAGLDLRKLLELDEESEDYEDNFNARHAFISQVYYKDEEPYTNENISKDVQQLAATFFELTEENK
jgi:hypothetical protein